MEKQNNRGYDVYCMKRVNDAVRTNISRDKQSKF